MGLRRRVKALFESVGSSLTSKDRKNRQLHVENENNELYHPAASAFVPKEQPPNALLDLPEDVLFAILSHLSCISVVRVSSTCRALHLVVNSKTVWLDVLESMLRPVPLSYRNMVSRGTTAELPLDDVRAAVIRATKLEKRWSQEVIEPTGHRYFPILKEGGRDVLVWTWNLDVGRYLMTYTAEGWFTCTIVETAQAIRFKTMHDFGCWDFDLDTEGITIVFNTGYFTRVDCMQVYRIELSEASWKLVNTTLTDGHVRSDFLEDEIAGCVLSTNGYFVVQVVDWRTGKCAIISTGIVSGINLSASTTKRSLLFCCGTMGTLDSWNYDFDYLKECVEKAEAPDRPYRTERAPQRHFRTQYVAQDIVARSLSPDSLSLTTRGMWTGRQCVFSYLPRRGEAQDYFLYSLVADESSASPRQVPSEVSTAAGASVGATEQFTSVSRRTFVYSPVKSTTVATGLYAIGHSGKHAIWIEDVDGELACRLATFNHEDASEEGPVTTTFSTVECKVRDFDWGDVTTVELDDNAGIIACMTMTGVWNLYFDA